MKCTGHLSILLLFASAAGAAPLVELPDDFILVAHRGHVTDDAPENSLAALDGAVASGYTHVEVDIRGTKDGVPVCLHDGNLKRTTGHNLQLADTTFEELRSLVPAETVPTLEEFCAHAGSMVRLMPDIKGFAPDQREAFVGAIRATLEKHNQLEDALFIGRPDVGKVFAGEARMSWRSTLASTLRSSAAENPEAFARDYFVFGHAEDFDAESVTGFQELGLKVIVSINEFHYRDGDPIVRGQQDIRRMVALGVDGLQLDTSLDGVLAMPGPGGAPLWTRHTIDDTSRGADGVRLGDINGDGRLDIATAWEEGGRIRVYLQPEPDQVGSPWPQVTIAEVPTPEDAVFMDLDSDGDLDVLSATEGRSNTLFLHFAPDDQARLLDADAWTTVPLPQSDRDTRWLFCLPLKPGVFLAAGKGENAGVYRYTCEGPPRDAASWKAERLGDAGWVMTMKALDQRRVLMSNRRPPDPGLFIIEEPQSESPVLRRVAESDEPLMFADYVARPDEALPTVYTGLQATAWQSFTPDGGSYRVTRHPLPAWSGTGKGVAVGDLDGDGLEDLALTCEHAEDKVGVWWISNVAGVGGRAITYQPVTNQVGTKFDRIELIDLDGDDDLDLMTCEEREGLGVIWYENPLN